jgi:hypothetical protein
MNVLWRKMSRLVRKAIETPVLAYHLIRAVTAQASSQIGIPPRFVSLEATIHVLGANQPVIAHPPQEASLATTTRKPMWS